MDASKVYVVTGAASGIGRATAQLLSRSARVFALDVDEAGLASLVATSPQVTAVPADLRSTASVEQAAARVAEVAPGGIDGLVNCAGLIRFGAMVEMSEEDVRAVMEVNTLGSFRTTKAFFPQLKAKKGRVVVISSEVASVTSPFNGVYSMSKYALEAYADALRRELALEGMKVVIIQPGAVKTALLAGTVPGFDKALVGSQFAKGMKVIRDLAQKEAGKGMAPEEVAEVVERALIHPRPAARYAVGNNPMFHAAKYLPASWLDAIMTRLMKG